MLISALCAMSGDLNAAKGTWFTVSSDYSSTSLGQAHELHHLEAMKCNAEPEFTAFVVHCEEVIFTGQCQLKKILLA